MHTSQLLKGMMHNLNAVVTIAFRDLTKLLRDRTRLLAGLVFPAIFIGILGSSLQTNFDEVLPYNYLTFVFTGVIAQVLFQSTASGMISLIQDRENDFAQELFIAPVSRYAIILGKIAGETMVAFIQVAGAILLSILLRVPFDFGDLVRLIPIMAIIAIFGGAFGLIVMSRLSDQRTVNQLFPFLLFPQFFLAGVFNPIQELPFLLNIASRLAPMTYAVDLLRSLYYFGQPSAQYTVLFPVWVDFLVVTGLTMLFLSAGTVLFVRNERNR